MNRRYLRLRGATGTIRTAKFGGKDHIVVPIVALVEGVVQAMGSSGPELVLASELEVAASSWNNRPVMNDHPVDAGAPVSANTPTWLEAASYGQIFNSHVEGKKLLMEEWIDPTRAAAIGGEAQKTVDRILAGESTEVSVGVQVSLEPSSGVYEGKPYVGIWRGLLPDHVANLPEGARGACSLEMGCGTLRSARITDNGYEQEDEQMPDPATQADDKPKRRTLRERFTDLFKRSAVKGWNQSEVRSTLRDALKQIEPLYNYIDDVWEEDGYVIYCVYSAVPGGQLAFYPDGYPMEPYTTTTYRRDFTMTEAGEVTFADRVEVEFVGSFQPVAAAGRAAAAPCACGGHAKAATSTPANEGESPVKTKAERIKALMENVKNPVKDQKALEAMDDATLEGLSKLVEEPAAAAAATAAVETKPEQKAAETKPVVEEQPRAAAAAELTEEQVLAKFPSIGNIVNQFKAAEAAKKTVLVTKLVAAQKAFTKEELETKTVEELTKIAAMLQVGEASSNVIDFSARAAGNASAQEDFTPPDPYAEGLTAMRAGKAGK